MVTILKKLSPLEVRELRKWVNSPAHNQRNDVVELFEYFFSYNRLEEDKFLTKEKIFQKVFPGEKFEDAQLRQTAHFLQKVVEDYLLYQAARSEPTQVKLQLACIYRERGIDKKYARLIRDLEKNQEVSPFRDLEFLQNDLKIKQEQFKYRGVKKENTSEALQQVSDALDAHYLAAKLRYAALAAALRGVQNVEIDLGLLPALMEGREDKVPVNFTASHSSEVYYHMYKTLAEQSDENYFRLKECIIEKGHLFPKSERFEIFAAALNYSISRMNRGAREFIREAFDMYRSALESGVLINNNTIDEYIFYNISANAIRLGEYEWAHNFIEEYKEYLPEAQRSSAIRYALAQVYFHQNDYEQAETLLQQFESSNLIITLNARTLLLRIYYEEGAWELLESLLESTRTYINRKKDELTYHREPYLQLIRLTRRLLRINPYDKSQKERLTKEVQAAQRLPARDWLLEQIREL